MKNKLLPKISVALVLVTLVLVTLVATEVSRGQVPDTSGLQLLGSEAETALSVTETVSSTFSYQGVLKESGQPVTGTSEIVFRLYSDAVCTQMVGSPMTHTVQVNDGLFNVDLQVNQADFDGQALWLETEVGGTSVGCQSIQAVPYALSLRPGAVIADESSTVEMNRATASGTAALYAESSYADLILGGRDDSAAGDDGELRSDPAYAGSDVLIYSNDEVWIDLDDDNNESGNFSVRNGNNENVFNVDEGGDVSQMRTGDGLVKAAVFARCSNSTSQVHRYFNNAGDAITIANGTNEGECILDLDFQITDRFWVVTALPAGRQATCIPNANDQLYCFRWSIGLGGGDSEAGDIMVLVY